MSDLWAIAAYFNPMHWRRRRENYRRFRRALGIPLVAVELGYDDQFDFDPVVDLARDASAIWRWNSAKPEMHAFVRAYFAGRKEDDDR